MRIGIDANCWANRRGYGRYTREIIRSILQVDTRNQYILFLDSETAAACNDLPSGICRVVVATSRSAVDAATASGHRSLGDLWALSRSVTSFRPALDLFYFPSVYTYFPVALRFRPVVTINDTIAERHPQLVFPRWRNELLWRMKVRWAVRRARMVTTVSETARRSILKEFALPEGRVRVVPNAVSSQFGAVDGAEDAVSIGAEWGIEPGGRFVLYVGGFSPHKNLGTLVDAISTLRGDGRFNDVRLAVVGDFERDGFMSSYHALRERVKVPGVEDRVIFTGYLPDTVLRRCYAAAQALVLPSIDEGFGLPAVEAMGCGTPVVASRAGALPEVLGGRGYFSTRSRRRSWWECSGSSCRTRSSGPVCRRRGGSALQLSHGRSRHDWQWQSSRRWRANPRRSVTGGSRDTLISLWIPSQSPLGDASVWQGASSTDMILTGQHS